VVALAPLELSLALTPRDRFDVFDVRARAVEVHKDSFSEFSRHMYASQHSTAGFLSQRLAARLQARFGGVGPYIDLFRTVFPEGAGYRHDQLDERLELLPEQKKNEPTNADSHLAFITGGLRACVIDDASKPGPVYLVDLDGTYKGVPRRRQTTIVGYNHEEEVARTSIGIPGSLHPIDAVNLRGSKLGLYDVVAELIREHGVTKGRVRLELGVGEQHASLTVNEYETLLMQHDLAEVLQHPLKFAREKVRHVWNDPRAVPSKARAYAKYDLPHTVNRLLDALGIDAPRIERLVARSLEAPASRFMRMRRSVDLLVSDSAAPGKGALIEGTYQTPILVQWRSAKAPVRKLEVSLSRFS
jgi:thiamine phosphate synthase YjbQ (UPF0047 family)